MATEVFEDEMSLVVGTLEAVYPTSEHPGKCYPYPELRLAGRTVEMAFRTVILENAYLRVTIAPDLGGRIVSFFDKRTGTEILPSMAKLQPVQSGSRGVELRAGILLDIGAKARLNAMGPVEYMIRDFVEEDEAPSVVLHELIAGSGVSWHATITLPNDRAELHLSVKTQNRQLVPTECRQKVAVFWPEQADSQAFTNCAYVYSPDRKAGLSVHYSDLYFESVTKDEDALRLARADAHSVLLPRQSDAWSCVIQPISGLASVEGCTSEVALSLSQGLIRVQSVAMTHAAKVILETRTGDGLEASVDLYPEKIVELDASGVPELAGLAIRDSEGTNLAVIDLSNSSTPLQQSLLGLSHPTASAIVLMEPPEGSREAAAIQGIREEDPEGIVLGLGIPGFQSASRIALALTALRNKQYEEALYWLEDAVNFNAEDHLLWWLKAVVKRYRGLEEEEDQDLPTAHFLAPLEPALRAESFLRQPQTHGKEPNPIIKPLANHPEALIEIACLLLEAGLDEEAMRWMDEARRHRDEPMLRYLQAWSLMNKTRMAVEAAELVRGVEQRNIEPPYPWRAIEKRALGDLHRRFPNDQRVEELYKLSTKI